MKFNEWTVKDHYPEKSIQDIEPISLRAYSLVSRNSNCLGPRDGAINLLGALEMLEALDYHFNNFMELGNSDSTINQKHEAVAYLNRLGQLYYFIKSGFTKKFICQRFLNFYRLGIKAPRIDLWMHRVESLMNIGTDKLLLSWEEQLEKLQMTTNMSFPITVKTPKKLKGSILPRQPITVFLWSNPINCWSK